MATDSYLTHMQKSAKIKVLWNNPSVYCINSAVIGLI